MNWEKELEGERKEKKMEGNKNKEVFVAEGREEHVQYNKSYVIEKKQLRMAFLTGKIMMKASNPADPAIEELEANKTCPKELRNVTGNIWEKTQPLEGTITSPDELCGIYKIIERDYQRVNYLEILKEKNLETLDQKPSNARIFISVKYLWLV